MDGQSKRTHESGQRKSRKKANDQDQAAPRLIPAGVGLLRSFLSPLELSRFSAFITSDFEEDSVRKPWSEEDIAKLRSMAQRYPTPTIAAELGRGVSATMMK